jgi:outer membrane biosynthesis protein TonB
MKTTSRIVLVIFLLALTTHRLPAPISEIPESPTPAPAVTPTAKPKPKGTIKPKAKSEGSETPTKRQKPSPAPKSQPPLSQKRFAGTWTGKIFRSGSGSTDNITVVVTAAETSATVSNFSPGPQTGRTTINGNTISWNWMLAKWTMTVNQDGQTAQIVADSPFEACRGTLEKSRLSQ